MDQLCFEQWAKLSKEEKKDLMQNIIQTHKFPFEIIDIQTFKQNNIEVETVIFEDNTNTQFVFVPGKRNVTLGFDTKTCEIGPVTKNYVKEFLLDEYNYFTTERQEIIEDYEKEIEKAKEKDDIKKVNEFEEYLKETIEEIPVLKTFDEWLEYVDSVTSPIRTVDINPMIVEVCPRPAEDVEEPLEPYFKIPTEDEWEYLKGAGTRTLFHWGDFLKEPLDAVYGDTMSSGIQEARQLNTSFLDKPNMFGLFITTNTYDYELVDSEALLKGGDGGCAICGGDGEFYVAPILSTFYVRDHHNDDYVIKNKRYLVRRIIRL